MPTSAHRVRSHQASALGWIPQVVFGYVAVVVLVGAFALFWVLSGTGTDSELTSPGAAVSLPGASLPNLSASQDAADDRAIEASAAPAPSPTSPSATDLISNARKIKPLEDIQKGDRVLYQGHVCTWQLWDKNINTSTIKCPGSKAFQIQTGRLTPVELRTGASKLVVER